MKLWLQAFRTSDPDVHNQLKVKREMPHAAGFVCDENIKKLHLNTISFLACFPVESGVDLQCFSGAN